MTCRILFRSLLLLGFALPQSVAQISCIDITTAGYDGNVTDAESCIIACGSNSAESVTWDSINGTFSNGTAFEAWRCICEIDSQTPFCSSIVVGEGDPQPPPDEPFDCFTLRIATTGRCGFACDVVYPERTLSVNYTDEENDNGDTYRECQCVLADPDETVTFCQGTTMATVTPTSSPTSSVEPTTSAPSGSLQMTFPTTSPVPSSSPSQGPGGPVTTPPSGGQTTPTPATTTPTLTFKPSMPTATVVPTAVVGNMTMAPTTGTTTMAPTTGTPTMAPTTGTTTMAPTTGTPTIAPTTGTTTMVPSDMTAMPTLGTTTSTPASAEPSAAPPAGNVTFTEAPTFTISSGNAPMVHLTVLFLALASSIFVI